MKITFTGIDSFTELDKLDKKAEYGVLFSVTNKFNRYPSIEEIELISSQLYSQGFNLALHVCGNPARKMLIEEKISFISNFQRVQVNGTVKEEQARLISFLYPEKEIIFQYNFLNKELPSLLNDIENVSFLVDSSGGKGISPLEWVNPNRNIKFGYAGGLGLDNIVSEVEKIKSIAREDFWIDMEGKIRDTEDKFDVNVVNQILEKIK